MNKTKEWLKLKLLQLRLHPFCESTAFFMLIFIFVVLPHFIPLALPFVLSGHMAEHVGDFSYYAILVLFWLSFLSIVSTIILLILGERSNQPYADKILEWYFHKLFYFYLNAEKKRILKPQLDNQMLIYEKSWLCGSVKKRSDYQLNGQKKHNRI